MSKALIPVFIYLLYLPESSHDLFSVVSMELNHWIGFCGCCSGNMCRKESRKTNRFPHGFPMVSNSKAIPTSSPSSMSWGCWVASSPPHGYLRWDDGVKSPSQCFEKSPKKINKHRTYRERERETALDVFYVFFRCCLMLFDVVFCLPSGKLT